MSITAQRLTVTRASGSCVAELSGLDLGSAPDDRSIAELRAAWLDHGVLFLRDAALSPRDFLAFAGRLGTPVEYPFVRGLDGFPQITPVIKWLSLRYPNLYGSEYLKPGLKSGTVVDGRRLSRSMSMARRLAG